jgi:hypothetical protein
VGVVWRYHYGHRQWPRLDLHRIDKHCNVYRLSNSAWCGERKRHADRGSSQHLSVPIYTRLQIQAVIAAQNAVSPSQYPIALAMLIFFQNLGTAITIVIANTIFAQTLTSTVPRYAPSISPHAALEAGSGAGAVRALVPAGHQEHLDGVLRAYSESLRNIFYFITGIACLAAFVSLGMGWKDVRNKQGKKTIDAVEEDDHLDEAQKVEV